MFLCCTRTVALLAIPLVTTACIGAEIDEQPDELIEEAEGAVVVGNSLIANRLALNALTQTALTPLTLSQGALTPGSLSWSSRAAIQNPGTDGALSRELLRYVVSCALRPDQSFSFSWTDSGGVSHAETYAGNLGIADWWAYGPLSDPYFQRWISACLASRTNWYGVSVNISLRGTQTPLASPAAERSAYTVREGAFWGNVFSSTPYLRSCHAPEGIHRARSMMRDCAAGHLATDPATGGTVTQACGPIALTGSCDTICNREPDAIGGYYSRCLDNPATSSTAYSEVVITSFLPP
ncbi:hypothetical protein BE15_36245 [Sorangium cellulosum]|uniref:Secreted protein n=1 Tax=Sorangium cellulosum TaxID=56 RepID=A0A150QDT9_SORCE|nr:hypothetical protein BE15_36245 [Sorangium cellulosum]